MKKREKVPRRIEKSDIIDKHWEIIVILLLFLIPFVYFSRFLSPSKMIAGSDYLLDGYPFEKYAKEHGGIVLWYPMVFGGFPALGAPVGGQFAPLALLKFLFPPQVVHALTFIIMFFVAGLGMYLYLKEIGISKYSAGLGAFVYQWAGNLATTPEAGHTGRAASIALFGLIIFFLHRALKTRKINNYILLTIFIALAFYHGHFQLTYYSLIVLIGYALHFLITNRKDLSKKDYIKAFGYGLVAILLIVLLMAVVWFPVIGGMKTVARGVERGYEYAASWNLPLVEIFDLFVYNFSGGLDNYWGSNPFKLHTEYLGILILVFAIPSLIYFWKRPYVKFFAITGLIALLYCLGRTTFIHRLFYELIPGFRLMRAPGLAFYLVSFSIVVIGSIGFDTIVIQKALDKKRMALVWSILFIGFILILFVIAPNIGKASTGAKLTFFQRNLSAYFNNALINLLFVGLGIAFIYLTYNEKIRISIGALIITGLTLLNQIPVMAKYLPAGSGPEEYYKSDDIVTFLKNEPGIFRVFPLQYGMRGEHDRDSYLLYHNIQSAGGYIANPLQRYQDFIGAGMSVMFNPQNLIQHPKFVDILNLKYIIAPNLPEDISKYDPNSQRIITFLKNYLARFKPVYKGYYHTVYQNDSALSRACLIPDYVVLPEEKVLEFMKSPDFNPRELIVLEESLPVPHPDKRLPMVECPIKKYTPNQVVVETEASYPGFLLLLDNWHPDWQVYVDGKKERLLRANYTFRAVFLPEGRHKVIFEYKSLPFTIGLIITITTICGLLGFYIPLGLWRAAVRYRIKH